MEFVALEELSTSLVCNNKDSDYPTESYVVLNRWKTNTIITGVILEECIRIYDYYLVFMTMDCPFEESLHVSLLNKNGQLLEKKDIFEAYYTDDFSDLKLYPPNFVTFDFLHKDIWKIEIYKFPKSIAIKPIAFFDKIFSKFETGQYKTQNYWKIGLIKN